MSGPDISNYRNPESSDMARKITSPQIDATPSGERATMGNEEPERNWMPIYVAVLIYTGLLIVGLALFSRET